MTAREEILKALRAAPIRRMPPRPAVPPFAETGMTKEALVECFATRLVSEGGAVRRAGDPQGVRDALGKVVQEEGIQRVMTTTDGMIASLRLQAWGKDLGIQVATPLDYPDRNAFKDAVFAVDAGITAVDFAVAESGTLVILHDRAQARLVSLAPPIHIAVVPVARVFPTHEHMMGETFGEGRRPSHVTFITGPSMTADIQATPFRGMHGPRKLVAILLG